VERSAEDAETSHLLATAVLRPRPQRSLRPWAGHRLGADGEQVGELWLAGPDSVAETALGPMTLDEVAATAGMAFVGRNGMRLLGARFPLLVKLIDAAGWLSLQVHPDDALAAELYGPRALGKTEAWVVLDATPDAELVTGPGAELSAEALLAAIAAGNLDRDRCLVEPCSPGETRLLRAGTLHAIGAGCFVYEIEQPSDLTFRISDWGRPETRERPLHRVESARAIRPGSRAELVGVDWRLDRGDLTVPEFQLELVVGSDGLERRPAGTSLEIVTAVRGGLRVSGDGWSEPLAPFETLVVPASIAAYRIQGTSGSLACVGRIP
jgi:mannose-6-phosphate isomerase